MFLYSFNGLTQKVQVSVFRQIRQISQICQEEFLKTLNSSVKPVRE